MPFQSTRPVRGATSGTSDDYAAFVISIHAPRAGRDAPAAAPLPQLYISIHAPRAGRDLQAFLVRVARLISIHAPRAGRDSKSIQNYFTHFCDKRQFLDNFTQNAAF